MSGKLSSQSEAVSEMLAQRNFYKKKADSLKSQVSQLLKKQNIDIGDIRRSSGAGSVELEKQLATVKTELKEAEGALTAFRRAFDDQHTQLRVEREANAKLANRWTKKGDVAMNYRLKTLQTVTNQLTETLQEKEMAIAEKRNTNKILAKRIHELEENIDAINRERSIERKVFLEMNSNSS